MAATWADPTATWADPGHTWTGTIEAAEAELSK